MTPSLPSPELPTQRYRIHGQGVIVRNKLPGLAQALLRALDEFSVTAIPESVSASEGVIRAYDKSEVLRHLSSSAVAISEPRDGIELYQDNERFWLIDDRWGLAEINMLKGTWRSWIVSSPSVDADCVVEMAVTWPIAQLLRGKGLHILPAIGMSRRESGLLILSPLNIEPELTAMVKAGYRIVGQRWVALRDDVSRLTMLHLPGRVERNPNARVRPLTNMPGADEWVDLEDEFCGSAIEQSPCDSVLMIEPGRRPTAYIRKIAAHSVLPALRRAWPIIELHPNRVSGQLPAKFARRCQVHTARLSQRPQDFLDLLESARQAELAAQSESAAVKQTLATIDRQLAQLAG